MVKERLVNGLDFIRNLGPDCGDVPMIGDSDTGLAVGWRLSDFWDFRSLPAIASVLLGEPRLAAPPATFSAEAYLMLGQDGLIAFNALKDAASREADAASGFSMLVFEHGGYQISRDPQFSIIFDTGPLGIAPAYGHGHADGLSFILHYSGNPVVVDPGTCLYNGRPIWRNYFRSCTAHNTIRLDDKDPVEPLGTFRWSGPLRIKQEQTFTGDGWKLLRGAVNWGSIVQRRFLIHILGRGVIILDDVDGTGEHEVEWRLHFDPRWKLRRRASGGLSAEFDMHKLDIMFFGRHSEEVSILCGGFDPLGGWYSRYYGSKSPTPTVRRSMKVRLPSGLLAAFKPSSSRLSVPRDLPWTLLPSRTADLLRSNEFSAFGGLLS